MVEVDDTVSKTLRKEFCEEALCREDATPEEREAIAECLEQLFANGIGVAAIINSVMLAFSV